MTTTLRRTLRAVRRSPATGFAVSMGVIALGAVALAIFGPDNVTEADQRAVQTYAERMQDLAEDGGRVVVTGMRPSLVALRNGELSGEDFRTRAIGWRNDMNRVRESFRSVKPPTDRLRAASGLFDDSMREYLRAIDAFVAASFKSGSELAAAITAAVPIAENADKIYDRAGELIRAEFERVGLEPPPDV